MARLRSARERDSFQIAHTHRTPRAGTCITRAGSDCFVRCDNVTDFVENFNIRSIIYSMDHVAATEDGHGKELEDPQGGIAVSVGIKDNECEAL